MTDTMSRGSGYLVPADDPPKLAAFLLEYMGTRSRTHFRLVKLRECLNKYVKITPAAYPSNAPGTFALRNIHVT